MLLLLAASLYTERWYQWGGIALLALASAPWRSFSLTSLGLITGLYCGWLLLNAILVSPVYAAEGIYQPIMLFGAFWAFANLSRDRTVTLFRLGIALIAIVTLLGMLQYLFALWQVDLPIMRQEDNPVRAAGTFVTPNTFAAALNMFLLPMVVLYVRRGEKGYLALVLWIFAGLVASQSRGGFVAALAGLAYVGFVVGSRTLWNERGRIAMLGLGCAVTWIAIAAAGKVVILSGDVASMAAAAEWTSRGTADRMELYATTLGLIREHPFVGAGANTFYSLFETVKSTSIRGYDFYYAHSDYLQVWLEFGIPGLALLIALAATSLWLGLRSHRKSPDDTIPLVCGAALTTCFAHAAIDFPLYIPFLLCVAGAYLGALSATAGAPVRAPGLNAAVRAARMLTTPIRSVLGLAALAWLSQPVLAELAVYRSIAVLQQGDARNGIYWQTVARRLEPRHPAHYWAEGMIWRNQAVASGDTRAGDIADALFGQGSTGSPFDTANLLGRIELNREHPTLLTRPAAPKEILHWAERAAALRPQKLAVEAELVLSLAHAGELERARSLARTLLAQYPESKLARRLATEI